MDMLIKRSKLWSPKFYLAILGCLLFLFGLLKSTENTNRIESKIKEFVPGPEEFNLTVPGPEEFNLTVYLERVKSGRMKPFHTRSHSAKDWLYLSTPIPNEQVDKTVCKLQRPNQTIDVLFIIISRVSERKFRDTLRNTWCSYSQQNTANVRCVFLLGNNKYGNVTKDVNVIKEANTSKDIVVGSFKDDYRNSTLKVMMGFKWTKQFCTHAKFVVKTDVDVWVDVPYLLKVLHTVKLDSLFVGRRFRADVVRDLKYKWGTTEEEWRGAKTFGWTCAGAAYVMTMKGMLEMLKIAELVPFLWMEDVYVSILAKALGYKIEMLPGYEDTNHRFKGKCDFKNGRRALAHMRDVKRIKEIWETQCSQTSHSILRTKEQREITSPDIKFHTAPVLFTHQFRNLTFSRLMKKYLSTNSYVTKAGGSIQKVERH